MSQVGRNQKWISCARKMLDFGLCLERAETNEDGQEEDQFDEGEGDEHCGLELPDSFRLSCHSVHGTEADKSEANSATKCGESEGERCLFEHVFIVSPVVSGLKSLF